VSCVVYDKFLRLFKLYQSVHDLIKPAAKGTISLFICVAECESLTHSYVVVVSVCNYYLLDG
jgi:hypothetical protein